jgi:hypothetical protein
MGISAFNGPMIHPEKELREVRKQQNLHATDAAARKIPSFGAGCEVCDGS